MSEPPQQTVIGNATARAIHGFSAGADCVLLGPQPSPERVEERAPADPDDLAAVLRQVCAPAEPTGVDDLGRLAALADSGSGPMVLADAGLRLSLPGALDLLDSPGELTAALVTDPRNIEAPRQAEHDLDRAPLLRVGSDGRTVESVGGLEHPAGNPNRVSVGLLRIRAADRQRAAELWRRAAGELSGGPEFAGRLYDLALLVLVRGGLAVSGRTLGYFTWSRPADGSGRVGQDGIGASPWQQRLRSASRLGDGAYSTAVARPLSRLGTRLALAIDLRSNPITMISIVIGVLAALLIMTGEPAAWIVSAVLIQLALVIDCMDGEVARFTRRFSTFGAWLDGIGDRLKEYLIFAAVAVVAAREGTTSAWPFAIVAMVLITARHLEDYAYSDRSAADRQTVVRPRPLLGGDDHDRPLRTTLPPKPTGRQKSIFWLKKIIHAPVAERTLIISLGLLTLQPLVVLIASIAVSGFALIWAVGGRLLKAIRQPRPDGGTELDQQLDLSVLGTRLAAPLMTRNREGNPGRLDWLTLPILFGVEAVVIMVAAMVTLPDSQWPVAFIAVAAVVYRRYELIYGIRLFSVTGPRPVLGADGRIVITLALLLFAQLITPAVLLIGLILLAAATALEGAVATAVRRRAAVHT